MTARDQFAGSSEVFESSFVMFDCLRETAIDVLGIEIKVVVSDVQQIPFKRCICIRLCVHERLDDSPIEIRNSFAIGLHFTLTGTPFIRFHWI